MSIGKRIKTWRDERGTKAQWVASQLDVTPETLSRWENGHSKPSVSNIVRIGKLLEWTPEEVARSILEES